MITAGCSSGDALSDSEREEATTEADRTSEAGGSSVVTTTTIANRPPTIREVPPLEMIVGERRTEPLIATDPDGDPLVVRIDVNDAPGLAPITNARGLITGIEWAPSEPGEWTASVTATDPDGLEASTELSFISRHRFREELVITVGDGVVAGVGRDRTDLVAGDPCGRAEDSAWPSLLVEDLIDAAVLPEGATGWNAACVGHTTEDLMGGSVAVTDRSGRVVAEGVPLDLVTSNNPRLVVVGIGANDLGLFDAAQTVSRVAQPPEDVDVAFGPDAEMAARAVAEFVDGIHRTTDAQVLVTTYGDPTADLPVGVDDCDGVCFAIVMDQAWATLNDALRRALSEVERPERLTVVDLEDVFEDHAAPNAAGPDALRDGFGPLRDLIDTVTGGGGVTCAAGREPDETYVSSLSCVYPNDAGHRAIADAVIDVLPEI